MRLIWSSLWEAFPREIHLISEFLIPSLRAPALASLAAPQEVSRVEGGRPAQASGVGRGWGSPPPPQDPRTRPPFQIPRDPVPGSGQGLACGREAATPLLFLTRAGGLSWARDRETRK